MQLDKYIRTMLIRLGSVIGFCVVIAGIIVLSVIFGEYPPIQLFQALPFFAAIIGCSVYLVYFLRKARRFKNSFSGKGYMKTLSEVEKSLGNQNVLILEDSIV